MGWLIFVAAVFVVVVAPVLSLVAETCEWSATAPPFDDDGAAPVRSRARDAGERIQSNVQTMTETNG